MDDLEQAKLNGDKCSPSSASSFGKPARCDNVIHQKSHARNIGVLMDSSLSMHKILLMPVGQVFIISGISVGSGNILVVSPQNA